MKPLQMTDKDQSREMPFRLTRRRLLSGMASLGVMTGGPAFGQKRLIIPEGDFAPLPIAIPNFVAGTPADASAVADALFGSSD